MASASDTTLPSGEALPRGLLRYSGAIAPDILAFMREAYPRRRQELIEPRWRWMFLASAARLGAEPMVWVYRSSAGVVAHQGAIAVKLHTPAGDHVTGWFVETMALEKVRGKAIGPMVVAKALQDLPFNLSLGQTGQMRELQYRLGWQKVAPLETLAFVLRGRPLVRGKVPAPVEPFAGVALSVRQALRYRRGRRRTARLTVREISGFTDGHDRLWQEVQPHYPVAVVRDRSYLTWKYVEQPGLTFVRLELTDGDEPRAVAVLNLVDPEGPYRYRRAFLNDIVVRPDDADLVWQTLEAARAASLRHGADLLLFDIISPPLVKAALAFGFERREPTRVLLIAPGDPSNAAGRHALEASNWLVTRGDSDIDRP